MNSETPLLINWQNDNNPNPDKFNNNQNNSNVNDDNNNAADQENRPNHVEDNLESFGNRIKIIFFEFRDFVDQRNVLDLAVAIAIGNSVSLIVASFVADIFAPIFGIVVSTRLSELFIVIKSREHAPYKTRDEARKDGAITWNYGIFIQLCLDFLIMLTILFAIMRTVKALRRKKIEAETTKECPFCFADIDGRAKKCSSCTAAL